jgi:hypothetical protein
MALFSRYEIHYEQASDRLDDYFVIMYQLQRVFNVTYNEHYYYVGLKAFCYYNISRINFLTPLELRSSGLLRN